MRINLSDNYYASRAARDLCDVWLSLGDIPQAVIYAERGVSYAVLAGNDYVLAGSCAHLAQAHHLAGKLIKAEKLFHEAEASQKKSNLGEPFLYSYRGFLFCDLLLSQGRYGEAFERANRAIEISRRNGWLADIALDSLPLGRACWLLAPSDGRNEFTEAMGYLNQAADGLRKAGTQDSLPLGLLARAACYRTQGLFPLAQADLDEV
ncbi:MAG: hypothetical protein HQK60_11010 [Deltaproteobacteria bacterium]|nr:hypothetical protein [Deltaproteobacteria bacterium]